MSCQLWAICILKYTLNIEFWKYNVTVYFNTQWIYNLIHTYSHSDWTITSLSNPHPFSAYNRKKHYNYATCTTKHYKITCLLCNMPKLIKSLKRYWNNPYIGVLYSCPKGMAVTTRYNPVGNVPTSVFFLDGQGAVMMAWPQVGKDSKTATTV